MYAREAADTAALLILLPLGNNTTAFFLQTTHGVISCSVAILRK